MDQPTSELITGNISEVIAHELESPSLDMAVDFAEMALDSFIQDDVLQQIPILSTVRGILKISGGIRDLYFLKKITVFFQEYHSNQIDEEKVFKFNGKFKNDRVYRNKVVEYLIVYIDRLENIDKTRIFAKLVLGHTEGDYNWDYFKDLVASLNIIHPMGIRILNNAKNDIKEVNYLINNDTLETTPKQEINLEKDIESLAILESAGLIFKGLISPPPPSDIVGEEKNLLTTLGCNFIKYGLS